MKDCASKDQDLFAFSQHELGFVKGLSMYMHLLVCAACRNRLSEFRAVSTMLMTGMRGGGPSPRPPVLGKLSIPVAAILLAGIGSTLFLAYNAVRPNFAPGDGPAKDMCATPIHSAPAGMHQFR